MRSDRVVQHVGVAIVHPVADHGHCGRERHDVATHVGCQVGSGAAAPATSQRFHIGCRLAHQQIILDIDGVHFLFRERIPANRYHIAFLEAGAANAIGANNEQAIQSGPTHLGTGRPLPFGRCPIFAGRRTGVAWSGMGQKSVSLCFMFGLVPRPASVRRGIL